MKHVTLVQFRKNAEGILRRVQGGERLILTRRGRPVVRLEPIAHLAPNQDDPIYQLAEHAITGPGAMTNRDIDRAIYDL